MRNWNTSLGRFVDEALAGRRSRREVVRRATALGLGTPLLAAGLTQQRQFAAIAAQDATPVAAPPTGEPITIGAAVSTTGSNGRTGLYQQEAYLLWEEQKNAAGGLLGRPVRMVLYDDQSDPATGARLYERLLTEDQVDLILGPYSSSVTQAVAQVTERAGQPMLAAGASASDIWARGYQYVFGVYSVAEDYFKIIVLDIAPAQGYTTAAGIEVLVNEVYPAEATDVSSVLTRVRDANPDMLIGGSYLPDSVLITRQSKELGVNPKLFAFSVGAAQPDFVESLGADADYVLGPSMWEPLIVSTGNDEFVAAYQAKFDREPDYHSAACYAACQVLEAAVTEVGGLDLDPIRDAIRALQMPTVLPGQFQVDENGKQIGHIALTVQWQDGEKLIVTPEDFAESDLRLPPPPWDQRG